MHLRQVSWISRNILIRMLQEKEKKFFRELILISIKKRHAFTRILTDMEWGELYVEAEKQSLLGVCYSGIEHLPKEQMPSKNLKLQWFGQAEYIRGCNKLVAKRAADVTRLYAEEGIRSVILKGQGVAMLYPYPELRTPGDIDIWVDCQRNDAITFLKNKGFKIGSIFIHHIDVKIFEDVTVEVHTNPSYTYSPIRWKKYKKWFKDQGKPQFQLYDKSVGFAYPALGFNIVYSLLHIFRHVFHEGIGLRQLLDYYYILIHSDDSTRREAMRTIEWFGLRRFAAAIMFVEQDVFALEDRFLLCKPDAEAGRFLLDDILQNGNFGQYNKLTRDAHNSSFISLYLHNVGNLMKMLKYYPSEVLWSPIWKPAHWAWRKIKGY